jgi:hypothetical protein
MYHKMSSLQSDAKIREWKMDSSVARNGALHWDG